ncbi:MAG TPA: DUF3300 domain-containing protein [Candidatus Eisenbacteria bacterium]|nr:DUF3300 domain-containing protein [Candidatus Eisenbacteria bacterium]
MTSLSRAQRLVALFLACVCLITRALPSAQAQDQPPSFSPDQLDQIVSRIALYPDPLLAQILTASTFSDQIPDAASWADQHHYLTGQALSNAITADQLPWDPSVQARFSPSHRSSTRWPPIPTGRTTSATPSSRSVPR